MALENKLGRTSSGHATKRMITKGASNEEENRTG